MKVREYRIMGRKLDGTGRITILRSGFQERMEAQVYMDTLTSAGRMHPKAYVTSRLVNTPPGRTKLKE